MNNKLVLILSFVASFVSFSNSFAQDSCKQRDAQFIGNVFDVKSVILPSGPTVCTFKIEFSMFNSNYDCPLYLEEVVATDFVDLNCEKLIGEKISGIVYKSNGVFGLY